ncbi:hypothetical protein ACRE_005010 [Hapsidospora chrysogenum ATCC 11550]|uniref:Uncharacterized protein n=1 Tax=Hapsidospora chrysogenum (strain ATCC 11550 / CBS 779.69 / DSM 880 / IAM 14645 / JCM 23072 / IMI 49137) TaxID=857340 RepID=A0A086THF7_HAPC1|nr:hypothetical protein ACRE_005010 [Hapsidospora chrysogenum ATCC 11550]
MATQKRNMSLGKGSLTSQTSLPPPYEGVDNIELAALSNASSTSSLPDYETVVPDFSSAASFHPTLSYQIETKGHPLIALPLPPEPVPIPVYAVTPSGEPAEKVYECIRPSRGSGSCLLYHVPTSIEVPVCMTTYRFGPGRPPKIRLVDPRSPEVGSSLDTGTSAGPASGEEEFEIVGRGCATRAVFIRTHLGTFQWRYANKAERKAVGADSLVIMERITTVAHRGGKTEEKYRRIAQLVRNSDYRSSGTGRSTAGNGGRLIMDLREWSSADSKDEARQMETIVVASCIAMLKKEVDRRRLHQAMVMAVGGT